MEKLGFEELDIIDKNLTIGLIQYMEGQPYKRMLLFLHTDEGTWDTFSRPNIGIHMDFINENIGWLAGGIKLFDSANTVSWFQLIYKTEDRGKSWKLQRDTVYNGWVIKDIKFYDENFGIASSGFSHVMVTTDGGEHWKDDEIILRTDNSPDADLVTNIQIPSETTAYVIHDFRSIYKYTREITNVDENENARMKEMKISPNPVGEYVEIVGDLNPTINRRVEGIAVNEIRIYNILGKCMLSEKIHPITQSYRMNIEHLPSGIYYVRLGTWVGRFVKIE